MHQILLAKANDRFLDKETLNAMFRFRHKVFYERLGWEVPIQDGIERDNYDELNPVYLVAKNRCGEIEGCWRLLPTTGPYMLKDTFPQLLCGDQAPQDPTIWEMSRLAVLPSNSSERVQVTLNAITFDLIRTVYEFSIQNDIHRYVLVTSVAVERLLKRIGFPIHRLGNHKPQYVGKVLTVACCVDINEQFRQAVYINYKPIVQNRVAA
ncbi:MAG: acyl-homoserine-lactone synthase [Sulfuricaulis sp.]